MGMQILVTPLSEVLHFVHMAMELEILDALVVYSNECLKGVPSAVGFPHCAGSGEGLFVTCKS